METMKKYLSLLLSLILVISLAACGSSSKAADGGYYDNKYAYTEEAAPAEMPEPEYWSGDYAAYDEEAYSASESGTGSVDAKPTGRKLIKTYYLDVQTLEFDALIKTLEQKVTELGGYVEDSSISGNSINYKSNRYASYTIRIPSKKSGDFLTCVEGEATVTSKSESVNDITLGYVDTESRISSLQTEYDRLLELLGQAENVDTIITLESRLSEVRYQLESYKSQLRTYDNQVDYSTFNVSVSEVQRVTQTEQETVWQRIGAEFSDSIYNVWEGLKDFFVFLIGGLPYFLVIALVIWIFVLIIKLIIRNTPKNRAKRKALEAQKKAAEEAAKKAAEEKADAPEEDKKE